MAEARSFHVAVDDLMEELTSSLHTVVDDLQTKLHSHFSENERQNIDSARTNILKVKALITVVKTKSVETYKRFLAAIDECNHAGMARRLWDKWTATASGDVPPSGIPSGEVLYWVVGVRLKICSNTF